MFVKGQKGVDMIEKTGVCWLCGGHFHVGEVLFRYGARHICSDCADEITTEDLQHLTGAYTTREMLTALGFDREIE